MVALPTEPFTPREDEPRPREVRTEHFSIYLAPPAKDMLQRLPFGSLAHHLGLDTWGSSLLSRRSALSLRNTAIVLLVVFTFDLATWSLFFNSILHPTADVLHRSPLTLVALLFALLIASATVIYERDFYCHDSDESWLRKGGALLIRLTVIGVAAAATALSLDILWFRGPILDRVHQESALSEVTTLHRKMVEATEQRKQALEAMKQADEAALSGIEQKEVSTAQTNARNERNRLERYEQDYRRASNLVISRTNQLRAAENALARAQTAAEGPQEPVVLQAQANVRYAAAALQAAQVAMTEAGTRLGTVNLSAVDTAVQNTFAEAKKRRAELETRAKEAEALAVAEHSRLREFVSKIRESNPGETVYEFGESAETNVRDKVPGRVYSDHHYHFFEQLRVLFDLIGAEPPKWRGTTAVDRDKLVSDFGLEYPNTPEAVERARRDAKLFAKAFWGTTAVALLIPFLVMAMKLVAPPDVRLYYSSRRQAIAAQPEAALAAEIENTIKAQDGQKRSWWQSLWQRLRSRSSSNSREYEYDSEESER